jgi:CRISPR-associated protein Cmr2
MNQYMLMFSLGPVQPFIEQSRKTRDLWLGSFLLSKLMEAALENIDKLANKIVFPIHRKVDSDYANLPNKYIAIFSDLGKAEEAAKLSTKGIKDRWDRIRGEVLNKIVQQYAKGYTNQNTKDIWDRQSDPEFCFEIQWVIVERDPTQEYKDWLALTEEALEARKRLRNFQQREERGEKSTISGERQALHGASDIEPGREQVRIFWQALATGKGHPERKYLSAKEISHDGSERLDAIDTIKRFATVSSDIGKRPFPSTSSIATASFVEGLLDIDQSMLQAWLDATEPLKEIPIGSTKAIPFLAAKGGMYNEILQRDGDCYFEGTFTTRRLEKDYDIANVDATSKNGREGLKKLLKVTDEKRMRRPTPYYAIIKMDADRMGEVLNTAKTDTQHMEISKALSDFTRNIVPHLVHDHYPGRVVYAGGDDVLALAPLARNLVQESKDKPGMIKTVIELADQVQEHYRERIQQSLPEDQSRSVTASTSIAIAHHYAPLSFVLRVMRDGERRLAKERYGRNSLVVTVIRRSGAQTQVGCRWEYKRLNDIPNAQPITLFSRFYDLFVQNILSPKCVYILLEEAPALVGLELDAQISEIKRVLKRQRDGSKVSELPDQEIEDLASRLARLAEAMDAEHDYKDEAQDKTTQLDEDKPHYGLVEALGWLLVMVFLTRKEDE